MDILPEQHIERLVPRQKMGETPEAQKIQADQELNLKGKVCPYTFVGSMFLEEMEVGEVLRTIIDYAPSRTQEFDKRGVRNSCGQ